VLVPILAGFAAEGYSHRSQYISELGARGADNGALVSLGGFLPIGVLALAFVVLALPVVQAAGGSRRMAVGLGCFAGIGAAYVLAAFARCEEGCPTDGDLQQSIHNLGGLLEYAGAAVGLLVFGLAARRIDGWRTEGRASLTLLPVVLVLMSLAEADGAREWRGAVQRGLEVLLFGWIVVIGRRLARSGEGSLSEP
jgi:hypothetical protein